MLGLEPEAITGQPLPDTVARGSLRPLLEAGRLGTAELSLPDGRTAQASVVPVSTPYGEPVGLAAIVRDITVLKKLGQMKNDFVNTVSHDLKNPIAVISTTSEMLLRTSADARARERYQRIWETSLYMNELVNDLLDLGKIEAGLDAPNERVELAAVVEDAVKAILSQAEAKRLALSVEVPAGLWVMAAPARLKQAFVNLVGNAVKYTPEGGTVEVRGAASLAAKPDDSTVLIRVTDTGIGIPAQDLSYVFDKFYRVRNKSTSGIPGTGLGLAIVKGIVEQHRGRIWVESNEGTGSTFFLELPLRG
jgi:two-component system phosphate regulon sensor histidine kinase PhoR